MTTQTSTEWRQHLGSSALPFVDSRIYTERDIFEHELREIWRKSWLLVAHESELSEPLDFRTTSIAREPVAVVRGDDGVVRAFLNVCPHRGALLLREPAGNLRQPNPSGSPKRITCMFHAWQFDAKGQCLSIPRRNAGYQDRLQCSDVSLHQLPCEGGLRWFRLGASRGEPAALARRDGRGLRRARSPLGGGALGGLSPSQGHRAHELQAVARDQ